MRIRDARSLTAAVMLSLLCGTTTSCLLPRMLGGRRDTGGIYLILAARADPAALEESVQMSTQVIERRCDAIGIYCKVERQGGAGSDRIKLRVSGAQDFQRVKSVLLAEGRLELRPVVSPSSPMPIRVYRTREEAAAAEHPDGDVIPYEEQGQGGEAVFLAVERRPIVTGLDVRDASAAADPGSANNYQINFTLKPEAARRFGEWTAANVNRYLAIVLNGRARSAPYIRGQITDTGQITGRFTKESAEDIALVLRSGNLPVRLEVLEEGTYKP